MSLEAFLCLEMLLTAILKVYGKSGFFQIKYTKKSDDISILQSTVLYEKKLQVNRKKTPFVCLFVEDNIRLCVSVAGCC